MSELLKKMKPLMGMYYLGLLIGFLLGFLLSFLIGFKLCA